MSTAAAIPKTRPSGSYAPASLAQRSSLLAAVLSQGLSINTLRHVVFIYFVHSHLLRAWRHVRAYGVTPSIYRLYLTLSRAVIALMLRIPALKRKVKTELDAAQAGIEAKLVVRPPPGLRVSETNHALPQHGKDRDWVIGALQELQRLETGKGAEEDGEKVWRSGRISGAVYHGGDEMSEVITQAIGRFILTNPVSAPPRLGGEGKRCISALADIVFAAAPGCVPRRAPHGVRGHLDGAAHVQCTSDSSWHDDVGRHRVDPDGVQGGA